MSTPVLLHGSSPRMKSGTAADNRRLATVADDAKRQIHLERPDGRTKITYTEIAFLLKISLPTGSSRKFLVNNNCKHSIFAGLSMTPMLCKKERKSSDYCFCWTSLDNEIRFGKSRKAVSQRGLHHFFP